MNNLTESHKQTSITPISLDDARKIARQPGGADMGDRKREVDRLAQEGTLLAFERRAARRAGRTGQIRKLDTTPIRGAIGELMQAVADARSEEAAGDSHAAEGRWAMVEFFEVQLCAQLAALESS